MVSEDPIARRESYDAARHRSALVGREDLGRIVISGNDRRTYLHGLLTNDIATLGPGHGCYAAYLTPQGRMITDMHVYELGDVVLMTLPREVTDAVVKKLDQFVFTEDVRIGDVSETFDAVAVVGPDASRAIGAVLQNVTAADLDSMVDHANVRAQTTDLKPDHTLVPGEPVIVLRVADLGVPGFELLIDRAKMPALGDALKAQGAIALDPEAAETLRIEGGVPKFHRDMDEETIPLEAGIESRAISLTKGCYVGQEVIIRVLHRGHGRVARKLVGLLVEGDTAPAPNAPVASGEAGEIGRVTSSTNSPLLGRPIALAYLHRDFVDPGKRVSVDGTHATTAALPFVAR